MRLRNLAMNQNEILEKIGHILRDNDLYQGELRMNQEFRADLGLDSLGLLTLTSEIEYEFGVKLSFLNGVSEIKSIQDLVQIILEKN
jgi:acyl carrier protein